MLWTTEIKAINPETNNLTKFRGPLIVAPSSELAERYCKENGLGYCIVTGKFAYYSEDEELNVNNN